MKLIWVAGITVGLELLSVSCLWGGLSDPQERNYEIIVKRNAFALKDIPPPPMITNALPPTLPPLNIKFTGITTWGGVKKAYFMIPDAAKPGSFIFPCLREGDRDGALEVLEIDEKMTTVKVRNSDRVVVLDFKTYGNNSPGPVAAIAGPQAPGGPGGPGGLPKPNTPGMFPVPGGQVPGMPQTPTMPAFTPQNTPTMPQATGGSVPTTTFPQTTTTTIPTRTIRAQASLPQVPSHSVEESAAKLMIQSQVAQPLIQSGEMPPLPPVE